MAPLAHTKTRSATRLPVRTRPAARKVPRALGFALAVGALAAVMPATAARWSAVGPVETSVALLRTNAPLTPVVPLYAPGEGGLDFAGLAPAAPTVDAGPADVPVAMTVEPLPVVGERQVHLYNVNTREEATFSIGQRGFVRSEEVAAVDRFFRCRRTDRQHAIAPDVLAVVGDIAERWPGQVIEIISGFRAPPFGTPHSRHFQGHAIDLRVRGVRTAVVRDYVWREHRGVGVGFYSEGDFLHVDARDRHDEIAWSARQESAAPEYNPRWAKRARHKAPHTRHALVMVASATK